MNPLRVNKRIVAFLAIFFSLIFTSCSFQGYWPLEQRLGLGPDEHLISVPYDPFAESASDRDKLPLYYFTSKPFDKHKPTILFCAGGPGIVPTSQTGKFLDLLQRDYNIVYFHARGSGYSQLPPSNSYDQYLRIRFAVEDIEAIRLSLSIPRWHAIIGYSYGTILAHQYAGMYGKGGQRNSDHVDKLVLIAPLSRDGLAQPSDAADLMELTKKQERINLERIYQIQFPEIQSFKQRILDGVQRIQDTVERQFGSLPFVIDEYDQLRNAQGRDLLKEHSLGYSKAFFLALRRLRVVGWFPGVKEGIQRSLGTVIATELGCKITDFDWSVVIRKKPISYCSSAASINKLTVAEPSVWAQLDSEIHANDLFSTTKKKQILLLDEIYHNHFGELTKDQINAILREVEQVIDLVYAHYKGLEFVIEKYQDLKEAKESGVAGFGSVARKSPGLVGAQLYYKKDGKLVHYSLVFFRALQAVMYPDRFPSEAKSQNIAYAALVIAREVARGSSKFNGFTSRTEFVIQGRTVSYAEAEESVNKMTARAASHTKALSLLRQLYDNELHDLQEYRDFILNNVAEALEFATTKLGGCLECVAKNYEWLLADLRIAQLDYDKPFFVALQNFATLSESDDEGTRLQQRYLAALLGKEIDCTATTAMMKNENSKLPSTPLCGAMQEVLNDKEEPTSPRVYNVVSVYDGLQLAFLKEWLGERGDFRRALRRSAGEVHYETCRHVVQSWEGCRYGPNQYVENIGRVDGEVQIKPWDPANYPHEVRTLILKGGADPVTVRNQPEYIISHALWGPRMLITLPGAGHDIREMLSSAVTTENPISANPKSVCYGEQHVRWRTDDDKPRRFAHANWFGCLISSFLKLDLEYFQQAKILTAIKTAFQEALEKKKMGDNHMEVFVCPRRNDWCYKW